MERIKKDHGSFPLPFTLADFVSNFVSMAAKTPQKYTRRYQVLISESKVITLSLGPPICKENR